METVKFVLRVCVVSGLALSFHGNTQASPKDQSREACAAAAKQALSKYRISPADITDTYVEFVRNTDVGTATTDVLAWFRVRQCPAGRLVVQMNPQCWISDIHTLGSCRIDGIPAY